MPCSTMPATEPRQPAWKAATTRRRVSATRDRRAVRSLDAEQQVGRVGHQAVGLKCGAAGHRFERPAISGANQVDVDAVDLAGGDELHGGVPGEGLDHGGAVAEDQGAVVGGGEAEVQVAGVRSCTVDGGRAAAPLAEAVPEPGIEAPGGNLHHGTLQTSCFAEEYTFYPGLLSWEFASNAA